MIRTLSLAAAVILAAPMTIAQTQPTAPVPIMPDSVMEAYMTPAQLNSILLEIDPGAQIAEGSALLTLNDVPVTVMYDADANRLRALVPIASAGGMTDGQMQRLLQANFDTALDARYALAGGRVWSVFMHPFAELDRDRVLSGMAQAVSLAQTYGTTFSSSEQMFMRRMCAKATMEEFEALLNESFEIDTPDEGSVVKGKVIAIEAGQAIIDVGYKMEGRVDLKEFASPGEAPKSPSATRSRSISPVENARGEAVISRERPARSRLGPSGKGLCQRRARRRRDLRPRQGRLHRRSRRRRGVPARLPGRCAPGARRGPLMGLKQPFQILKMDRRRGNIVVSRRAILEESRAEQRAEVIGKPQGRRGRRRRGQEHHRIRRVRRSRRCRRPAARHRHGLAPRQPPLRDPVHRRDRQGAGHQDQQGNAPHQPRHEAAAGRSVGWRRGQVPARQRSIPAA
jgi:hypothetical protein